MATTDVNHDADNPRYLSIDYHLANLLLRSYGNDRATTLQRVLSLYDSFLSRLDNYGLLSTDDRKTFERFAHDPTIFSLAAASDFTERRRVKVANFQAEKTLKLQLEVSPSPLQLFLQEPTYCSIYEIWLPRSTLMKRLLGSCT